jgi:hypothetical protein
MVIGGNYLIMVELVLDLKVVRPHVGKEIDMIAIGFVLRSIG